MNETISKWMGEEREHGEFKQFSYRPNKYVCKCGQGLDGPSCFYDTDPDYSGDPAAWDDKLYKEIEDKGLAGKFVALMDIPDKSIFGFIKATPLQKATALARAIKEAG